MALKGIENFLVGEFMKVYMECDSRRFVVLLNAHKCFLKKEVKTKYLNTCFIYFK